MSQEAMQTLNALEERIRRRQADAAAAAKEAISAAKAEGERLISDAKNRADDEIAQLRKQVEEAAKAAAREKAQKLDDTKAQMIAKAEAQRTAAVALIMERIVNG